MMQGLKQQKEFWDRNEYMQFKDEEIRKLGTLDDLGDQKIDVVTSRLLAEMGVKKGGRILVLGCGPGYELDEVGERVSGGEIVAIEPSDMIKEAKKRVERSLGFKEFYKTNVEFVRAFGEHLPLHGEFDCAISLNTFRYLEDPVKVYGQVFGLLGPEGRVGLADSRGHLSLKGYAAVVRRELLYDPVVIRQLEKINVFLENLLSPQEDYRSIVLGRNRANHEENMKELEFRTRLQSISNSIYGGPTRN